MAVYVRARLTGARVQRARFVRLVQQVLSAAGESASELSIELIGDRRMRRLNRVYRKKDQTTDVLAFAMRESFTPHPSPLTPVMLGDVVISVPTATRQAEARGHSLAHEIATLLIHGVLHLCGYDHDRGEPEARRMRRKEQAVLRSVLPLPKLVSRTRHGSTGSPSRAKSSLRPRSGSIPSEVEGSRDASRITDHE